MLSLMDTMVSLVVKVLWKFISLICFRVYLEVNVYKNPTCFSRWSVSLVFYDNNDDVELFIRKQIDDSKVVKVFNQVNNLNVEYRGMSFYLEDSIIVLKSYLQANGNVENVLRHMVGCMQVATEEFLKIK